MRTTGDGIKIFCIVRGHKSWGAVGRGRRMDVTCFHKYSCPTRPLVAKCYWEVLSLRGGMF
jgi:hypothetical protein